jgi:cytochrome c oxidase subunit 2
VIRYRDRGQAVPEQSHGKPALEIILTVIPAVILFGVGIATYGVIFDLYNQHSSGTKHDAR